MPRALPEDMKSDIKAALLHRREPNDIVEGLGIHIATVKRYRKRFSLQPPVSTGQHSIVSGAGKRHSKLFVIRGQLKTAQKVYRKLTEPGYACQICDGNMSPGTYQHILDTTYMETLAYFGINKSFVYLQHDSDPEHKSKSTQLLD
ncbi:hypothetical protein BCV72DRAFT_246218 [Rhizopus microsporus var. microsporus]|uniref:Uncharacterized protein n=2 Tax=Rhizopus microsporus TaxID=58291 RepID=A0A2G4SJE0_RHIZD|nr:uncharacterized protein RHIMIDRAFT_247328 [Rhizopus microsporus ATCC 52813]ORE01071.1 hypothetical protein BCV72DRAFT_246218 [Rhizopus microsporus var. microsporus]PHZ08885.1 hypothetical protein RHIMIDRAFT_247328 [Rhizopus microsporus ATCC 52813]